jgi:hypothetical protein
MLLPPLHQTLMPLPLPDLQAWVLNKLLLYFPIDFALLVASFSFPAYLFVIANGIYFICIKAVTPNQNYCSPIFFLLTFLVINGVAARRLYSTGKTNKVLFIACIWLHLPSL